MPAHAPGPFRGTVIVDFHALIAGGVILRLRGIPRESYHRESCHAVGIAVGPAGGKADFNLLAEYDLSSGQTVVGNHSAVHCGVKGDFSKPYRRIAITPLYPYAVHAELRICVHGGGSRSPCGVLCRVHVGVVVHPSLGSPVFVDFHFRLETQRHILGRNPVHSVGVDILITVTNLAAPFHVVHLFFQRGHPHAEAVQLLGELRRQLVDQRLIAAAFRHCPCDHLSHFISGDFLFPAVSAVSVSLYDAVGRQLRHCVIRPVISGNVLERIRRDGGWICSAENDGGQNHE